MYKNIKEKKNKIYKQAGKSIYSGKKLKQFLETSFFFKKQWDSIKNNHVQYLLQVITFKEEVLDTTNFILF